MKQYLFLWGVLLLLLSCRKDSPTSPSPVGTGINPGIQGPPPAPPPGPPPGLGMLYPNGTVVAQLSVPRALMASIVCNDKFLFAGGYTNDTLPSKVVDIYEPKTGRMTSAELSLGRNNIAAAAIGKLAFFAGGCSGGWEQPYSRVDIYNEETDTWQTAELSEPRHHIAAGAIGTKVFFAGGIKQYPSYTSRVDIYDVATNSWSKAELSKARGDLAAAVLGNKILFAGGRTATGSSSRVDIYDADTDSWSTAELSRPCISLTSTVLQGKAFFCGSAFGLPNTTVDIYDLATNSWSVLELSESKIWVPVGYTYDKVVFLGGMLSWFTHSKKIEILDPVTKVWDYKWMTHDLMWQSVISYNGSIYSAGGAIEGGDYPVSEIYRIMF